MRLVSRRGRGAPSTRGASAARRSRRWRADLRRQGAPPSERDRNKIATQAKRRNGCNGPGALELRWALGARGALAPKDRERAAALLDDNEGRGLDACPREVAKGLSRPLGDVLAWYYAAREPDDKEGEKDA